MKHRRILSILLAAATAVSVAGCSKNETSGSESSAPDDSSSPVGEPTASNVSANGWEFNQVAMGGGGFVSGVFATSQEGLYYARTDVGGAYRYNKDTQLWESMSYGISEDDQGFLGIAGLAYGDKDPNRVYLLAGTSYLSGGRTALFISNDYGSTFTRTELTDYIKVDGNGMGRGNGERLAVDPKNSDIVYAGGMSSGGLIKSTDGGQTFTYLDLGTATNTNNNNGIPIPYGGSYPIIEGNDIFVFPGYMGDSKNELVKYTRNNGQLSRTGTMKLPPNSSATNIVFASTGKAYLSMAGLGKIAIFDPTTMTQQGEIDLTSLGVSDSNPDPSAMLLRDGLLFVGLSQMVGGWIPPQDRPYSDIAIIDTQTDKLLKMITDKTSGISMPTRPIDRYSIFMDEKKDIYISCMGGFGMVKGHNAGVLRIKAGETEFDPTYQWTITGAAISGEEKTAGFISAIRYVGNGKAYAYINMPGYYKPGEQGHTAIADLAVEIDLYNKTMKKVQGLDLSNGFGVMLSLYKGSMLIGNSSAKAKGIYSLDIQTGEVSKEPILTTVGNPILCYYFEK